jgi:hypothetical protein
MIDDARNREREDNSLIVGPRFKRQDSKNLNDAKSFAVRAAKAYRRAVV